MVIESDTKQVVEMIRRSDSSSIIGLMVHDCIELLRHFNNVIVKFIRRLAIHRCVRATHYMSGSREWSSTPIS